jgi:hypothetical protein
MAEPVLRTLETLFAYAWPWSIGLFFLLALLVFPDGLLPGGFWRATVWFTVLNGCCCSPSAPTRPRSSGAHDHPWLVLADYASSRRSDRL